MHIACRGRPGAMHAERQNELPFQDGLLANHDKDQLSREIRNNDTAGLRPRCLEVHNRNGLIGPNRI